MSIYLVSLEDSRDLEFELGFIFEYVPGYGKEVAKERLKGHLEDVRRILNSKAVPDCRKKEAITLQKKGEPTEGYIQIWDRRTGVLRTQFGPYDKNRFDLGPIQEVKEINLDAGFLMTMLEPKKRQSDLDGAGNKQAASI